MPIHATSDGGVNEASISTKGLEVRAGYVHGLYLRKPNNTWIYVTDDDIEELYKDADRACRAGRCHE